MKKILITTFHRAENYGAQLQCYALQECLKKIVSDKEIKVLDYRNDIIENPYRLFNLKQNGIKKNIKDIVKYIMFGKRLKLRKEKYKKFIDDKLNLTESVFNINDIKTKYNNNTDVFITGSDQVWSKKIVGELSDVYTLNFDSQNAKRISYAASMGDTTQISKNTNDYLKINNLDNISVREEDAKVELNKIIDKDVEVVLDPTLLLDSEFWDDKVKDVNISDEKYILAYVVQKDDEYIKIVNKLSEKTGLKVIHFGLKNPGYKNVLKSEFIQGPLEFVKYIKNAEYVVSTSFHATVFSIIYNKKFFIVPHRKTGNRVINLLNKLDIKNRAFSNLEEFEIVDYNFETNWENVNKRLEIERKKSIKWLQKAIN